MKSWSTKQQVRRKKEILTLYRQFMAPFFDGEGNWQGSDGEIGTREKLWHCMALLEGSDGDSALANKILAGLTLEKCHFAPMNCMELLLGYEHRLSAGNREKLEAYVKESLPRQADKRIHCTMYNDNFAAMAVFTLLAAGERFRDRDAFQAGRDKLDLLAERYMRCGAIMEYCSPTYLPLNIHAMAQIVNYVRDIGVKRLALKCEERGWAEAATHYHAPSGHLAGPYSRAYTVDTVGHPHIALFALYMAFGGDIFINPVRDMFPPHREQVIHVSLERLMWPNLAWLCCGSLHCPDYLAEILLDKKYPYSTIARTECLPSHTRGTRRDPETGEEVFVPNPYEYAAYSGPIYTYMMPDFSMGTACSQYHDGGLTESFYATYRKTTDARRLEDTGVVFCRYLINERKPEETYQYAVYGEADGNYTYRDEARKFGLQHKDCSLMVYKPKQFEAHRISSLKLSILFPVHFAGVEEVRIGNQRLEGNAGESAGPETVFVKDGPVYMAFTPLTLTDHGRKSAVKVETVGRYLMLSFYNYEGPAKAFDVEELLLTSSGFVAVMKSAEEFGSFEEFIAYVSDYTLSDETTRDEWANIRRIRYKNRDVKLEFAYSPISEGIMIATVNGKPRPEPVIQATGLNTARLPLL